MGIIILTLACVALAITLVVTLSESSKTLQKVERVSLENSNSWLQAQEKLEEQRNVNNALTNDLASRSQDLSTMTNQILQTSNVLTKTEDSLKQAQDEVARRDSQIAELEAQNKKLDEKAFDLSNSITNLQSQIDDTQKKLAASEGDKAFLQKELERLMAEKAELERQFNDLKVMRAQVAKLKEELNISRRLAWIREGIFAREEQKGAEQLMQKSSATATASAEPKRAGNYDLNVQVNADGSVSLLPPGTNNPVPK